MKFIFKTIIALLISFVVTKNVSAADYNFKFGTVSADTEPLLDAMRYMAKNIEDRSDGRIAIDVYGGAVLGTNKEVYEQVKNGGMVMTIADFGYLADYYPDMGIIAGPYLLPDVNDFDKLLKSDWYSETLTNLEAASGLKVTAANWFFGARHIITNKPIKHPDDMKDVPIRVPPNIMWVKTFESMGANGTQVAWAEVYGVKHIGSIKALTTALMVFATAFGTALFGFLIDSGFSIEKIAIVSALYILTSFVLLLFVRKNLNPIYI